MNINNTTAKSTFDEKFPDEIFEDVNFACHNSSFHDVSIKTFYNNKTNEIYVQSHESSYQDNVPDYYNWTNVTLDDYYEKYVLRDNFNIGAINFIKKSFPKYVMPDFNDANILKKQKEIQILKKEINDLNFTIELKKKKLIQLQYS